jgi:hypothetical protein
MLRFIRAKLPRRTGRQVGSFVLRTIALADSRGVVPGRLSEARRRALDFDRVGSAL